MEERHLTLLKHERPGAGVIGEFGGGPAARGELGLSLIRAAPAYQIYETMHAALYPVRAFAEAGRRIFQSPANPLAAAPYGRSVAAACELLERSTRRYGKPEWNIDSTVVGGERVPVQISSVWARPFCQLLHFDKALEHRPPAPQPRLLIVAPMSGHYPTLLRETVQSFLPAHDVYLTEWIDARMVPRIEGRFDLDNYIDYVISILRLLGGGTHIMACTAPGSLDTMLHYAAHGRFWSSHL